MVKFEQEPKGVDDTSWVFDNKTYTTEDGIDLDMDKVEEIMKPQPGARYVGDVRDKSFVPVGFKESYKNVPKPRVEFKKPGVHTKASQKIVRWMSRVEHTLFDFIKKNR